MWGSLHSPYKVRNYYSITDLAIAEQPPFIVLLMLLVHTNNCLWLKWQVHFSYK